MAQNPFKQNQDYEQDVKRSSFDLSFANNFTANFGLLYPVFCREVLPGDSLEITSAMAMRAMPLPFPVQTRCKAYVHFFYQRNKNLWKDWQDFIAGNKPHEQPFGNVTKDKVCMPHIIHYDGNHALFKTGGLLDYLGLPTTNHNITTSVVKDESATVNSYNGTSFQPSGSTQFPVLGFKTGSTTNYVNYSAGYSLDAITSLLSSSFPDKAVVGTLNYGIGTSLTGGMPYLFYEGLVKKSALVGDSLVRVSLSYTEDYVQNFEVAQYPAYMFALVRGKFSDVANNSQRPGVSGSGAYDRSRPTITYHEDYAIVVAELKKDIITGDHPTAKFSAILDLNVLNSDEYKVDVKDCQFGFLLPFSKIAFNNLFKFSLDLVAPVDDIDTKIFDAHNPLSALRPRTYESIYNSFYRDRRNNPFFIDGVESFNEYLPSRDGGLDEFDYRLHKRNWELDQFTSCVPSPQQGVAPLVGFSNNGDLEYQYSDGSTSLIAKLNSDAELDSVDVKSAVRSLSASLQSLSSSGISINDFRNVNAYQRWKETNIRRGLKYKDQIKARWGIDLKESLLDMPEFIGGFSCDIDVNTVSSTTQTDELALGSYAGQMSCFGKQNHKISHFCDDYGFIMGIVCIVPTPVYSSVVPKDFFKFSPLDYFSPEFDRIGMQPVPYKELVGPLSIQDGYANETFGYQRPWYEYLSAIDESHGLFRTELQNFILNREFNDKPLLGESFTTIDHNDLNDIFATDYSYGDKFLGQIYFNVTAKRPISKISIPGIQ